MAAGVDHDMDREIELKFLIPPEAATLALAQLKGEGAVRQLDATYFDTPGHVLRKAGYGLRVRDGEGGRNRRRSEVLPRAGPPRPRRRRGQLRRPPDSTPTRCSDALS